MVANTSRIGPKLKDTYLLHSSPPVEFFQLFIRTDGYLTKMAEQTNFYAVQRGSSQSFKPVHHGAMNLYLNINIHTDRGRRPEAIFACSLCKTHPCNELCFAQLHAKIRNMKKKKKTRKVSL